jgi:hypothetical protein
MGEFQSFARRAVHSVRCIAYNPWFIYLPSSFSADSSGSSPFRSSTSVTCGPSSSLTSPPSSSLTSLISIDFRREEALHAVLVPLDVLVAFGLGCAEVFGLLFLGKSGSAFSVNQAVALCLRGPSTMSSEFVGVMAGEGDRERDGDELWTAVSQSLIAKRCVGAPATSQWLAGAPTQSRRLVPLQFERASNAHLTMTSQWHLPSHEAYQRVRNQSPCIGYGSRVTNTHARGARYGEFVLRKHAELYWLVRE